MIFDFLVSANAMYRLVQVNGTQKNALEKIPDLDGTIKRCGYYLEGILYAESSRGNDVGVALIA